MPTPIDSLGTDDAAAARSYSIVRTDNEPVATNPRVVEEIIFPKTTNANARFTTARAWTIQTGYAATFTGEANACKEMVIGYNADFNGPKDVSEPAAMIQFETDYYERLVDPKTVTAITRAATAQLTVTNHQFVAGMRKGLVISGAPAEWQALDGNYYTIQSIVDANNFTINLNSSAFSVPFSGTASVQGQETDELYFVAKGGTWNNNSRPLFFAWARETGRLTASIVHAADASAHGDALKGFWIVRPTIGGSGGSQESGGVLWRFTRNALVGECDDTTQNVLLNLKGGSTNRGGQITLGYGVTNNALSIYPASAGTAYITVGPGGASIIGYATPQGGNVASGILLGRAGSEGALGGQQILGVGLELASTNVHGIVARAGSAGTGDLMQLRNSSNVTQWSVTRAGLLTASTTQATTGATTITPAWTNKPGANTTATPAFWIQVSNGTTTAWIPAWAN